MAHRSASRINALARAAYSLVNSSRFNSFEFESLEYDQEKWIAARLFQLIMFPQTF
jgi:hypothetical protein